MNATNKARTAALNDCSHGAMETTVKLLTEALEHARWATEHHAVEHGRLDAASHVLGLLCRAYEALVDQPNEDETLTAAIAVELRREGLL